MPLIRKRGQGDEINALSGKKEGKKNENNNTGGGVKKRFLAKKKRDFSNTCRSPR